MLDARYVADHFDEVRAQLARRGAEFAQAIDGVVSLVTSRRELTRKTELLQAERNSKSDEMAKLAKSGDKQGMAARRDELKALSEDAAYVARRPELLYYLGRSYYAASQFTKAVDALERFVRSQAVLGREILPAPL